MSNMPSAMTEPSGDGRVEVLVVGGGLSGLAMGVACAVAGLEVAVVDREAPAATLATAFDGRTTALAFGSQQVLAGIGVWPLVADEAEPILDIRIADGAAPLFLHYDHRAVGNDPFGWIIENRTLRRALLERARSLPTLRHIAPCAVERVDQEAAGAVAALSDGSRLRAPLVIAADGRGSPTRDAAGIGTRVWRYGQTSIVCTVRHQEPHRGVAVEHFYPGGPFAILPMSGRRSSIVWSERDDLVPGLLALDEARFTAELGRRFGDWLGPLALEGGRWSYPLSLMLAERYAGPRLALVSEAAHAIHPIAGQGLNLGIRDIAALAELVVDQRRLGLDLGDPGLLARYEQWRRIDTMVLAGVTDGLNRLFSNAIPPVALARDLGLAAVNRMPPVKRLLMRHAMGLLGERPRLMRGAAL
jgi:2-octaprenyl-6-methoxyphenol hydroxylase